MDGSFRQKLAQALLGNGMASQAANTQQLYPMWQQKSAEAQQNGQAFPQFNEWVQQYQQQNQPQPNSQ